MKTFTCYLTALAKTFLMVVIPLLLLALVLALPALGFLVLVCYLAFKDIMFSTDKK